MEIPGATRRRPVSVLGRVRSGKMQALERSKPLVDLPELHFDGTQTIIHATQIGRHPGNLHAQRDDRADSAR